MNDGRDLPESVLKNSKTWVQDADAEGICLGCGEHTDVLSPCCGDSVDFEGGSECADDLWSEIEEELACLGG